MEFLFHLPLSVALLSVLSAKRGGKSMRGKVFQLMPKIIFNYILCMHNTRLLLNFINMWLSVHFD